MRRSTLAVLMALSAPPAAAQIEPFAQLSGSTWDQTAGAPLAGCEVRLWQLGRKGYVILATTTSSATGAYSFTAHAGRYLMDARGPATGGNYADRWYDVAPPNAQGWAGEDADPIDVVGSAAITGVDIVMVPGGGLDARLLAMGAPYAGAQARLVRAADPRIHHNDQSRGAADFGAHLGRFYMRGLPPAGDWRLLLYDPSGVYAMVTTLGPYGVAAAFNTDAGDIDLTPAAADPYEPNGTAATAASVDGAGLRAGAPWSSSGAAIGAADIDLYCWPVERSDRYIVTVGSTIDVAGTPIPNPWLDPMAAFVDAATLTRRVSDDDGGPGRDPRLDTGAVDFDGTGCVAITTFGDDDFDGSGQQSTGPYTVRIAMGNRPPRLTLTDDTGAAVPRPPATHTVAELQDVVLHARFQDPEGDTPWAVASLTDATGAPVSGWLFSISGETATFSWSPDATAAADGPFHLVIEVGDDELSLTHAVILAVANANFPPTVPELLSPEAGATVTVSFPVLVLASSTDADGEPLRYELEAYADGASFHSVTVDEGAGGTISYRLPFVADGTTISWRARATDGNPGGLSAWSDYSRFLVDAFNDPPAVPLPEKPDTGERVLVRRPALRVLPGSDPENDPITVVFELDTDSTFTTPLETSAPVPETGGMGATFTPLTPLPWGTAGFWRARALDDAGATSAWSEVSYFRVKPNVEPSQPALAPPFGPDCDVMVLRERPAAVVVVNAEDPEGEPVSLELEVLASGGSAVIDVRVPQSATGTTSIAIDGARLEENRFYRMRVRADDGTSTSDWVGCAFWMDAFRAPASLNIIEPADGATLSADDWDERGFTTVWVTNPLSGDSELPGYTLALAWCLAGGNTADACNTPPTAWNRLAFHDAGSTSFRMGGLVAGARWSLAACALDPTGECIAQDSVTFTTAGGAPESGCGCRAGGAPMLVGAVLAALRRRRRAPGDRGSGSDASVPSDGHRRPDY